MRKLSTVNVYKPKKRKANSVKSNGGGVPCGRFYGIAIATAPKKGGK